MFFEKLGVGEKRSRGVECFGRSLDVSCTLYWVGGTGGCVGGGVESSFFVVLVRAIFVFYFERYIGLGAVLYKLF